MLKLIRPFVTVLTIAGLWPASAQEAGLWQFVRPDAKMLLGIDWRKTKASPAGDLFRKQFEQAGKDLSSPSMGLDFLEQVDHILLSANSDFSTVTAQGGSSPPPMLIALSGRIDRTKLNKLMAAGTGIERWRGVDLLIPPKSARSDAVIAVVSERLALMGDRPSVEQALAGQSSSADPALLGRARRMAAQSEIWVVANPVTGASAPAGAPGMKQLEDIESLDLGVSLRSGFGLRMNFGMKSAESAQAMALMTQMMAGMMVTNKQGGEDLLNLMRELKVNVEGANVALSLDMPLATLQRAVNEMRSGAPGLGQRSLESILGVGPPSRDRTIRTILEDGPAPEGTVRLPAAAPEPETRTIRIVGLEEGEREVKYPQPAPSKPAEKKKQ
jgi:hypothetical protein